MDVNISEKTRCKKSEATKIVFEKLSKFKFRSCKCKWHSLTDILNQLKIHFKTEKNTCVKILKRVMFYNKICIFKYV